MTNEWRKQSASKRGGDASIIAIDAAPAEAMLAVGLTDGITPELEYERSWAREILIQAKEKLRTTYEAAEMMHEYDAFTDQLELGKSERTYREIATELGVDEPRRPIYWLQDPAAISGTHRRSSVRDSHFATGSCATKRR